MDIAFVISCVSIILLFSSMGIILWAYDRHPTVAIWFIGVGVVASILVGATIQDFYNHFGVAL